MLNNKNELKILSEFFKKYNNDFILELNQSNYGYLKILSLEFYKDTAEVYSIITRATNIKRNPAGYDLNEAPILGLLVRISKILKHICYYYEKDNGDIISLLDRPLIESSIHAIYLLKNDKNVVEDYRKCAYQDHFFMLNEMKKSSEELSEDPFRKSVKARIEQKMKNESLTPDSFEMQIKNKWRLQGLTFKKIFSQVEDEYFYPFYYGMASEAIHGSWNHSLDYDLTRSENGVYYSNVNYRGVDIRFIHPVLNNSNKAFKLWLERIELDELRIYLDKVDFINSKLYIIFTDIFRNLK